MTDDPRIPEFSTYGKAGESVRLSEDDALTRLREAVEYYKCIEMVYVGFSHDPVKIADLSTVLTDYEALRQRCEAAERDLRAELNGNAELRQRLGAKDNETFITFVERLAAQVEALTQERDEARALYDAVYQDRLDERERMGKQVELIYDPEIHQWRNRAMEAERKLTAAEQRVRELEGRKFQDVTVYTINGILSAGHDESAKFVLAMNYNAVVTENARLRERLAAKEEPQL